MRKFYSIAPLLLGYFSAVFAHSQDVGALLKLECEQRGAPGALAAVVRDGKIVAEGVFGVRELGSPEPVELNDAIMIGSCGKSATRLLIGRLVDRGLLKFESTLGELLPDVPMRAEYKTVTIVDILGHRGGIPAYTEIGPMRTPSLFESTGSPQERRARFASEVLNEPPAAPRGTRFVYSNAGYGLLGHIAERLVPKKPFEELIRNEVFEPLGMNRTFVGLPNSGTGRVGLVGHHRTDGAYSPQHRTFEPIPAIAPAGLMSSSIGDFARLAAYLAAAEGGAPGEFLKPETAERIHELRPGDPASEGEIFYGGDGYYTAAFALWPSKRVAIVVGTNAGGNDEVCEAVIHALRRAFAPDIQSRESESARRPKFGFMIEAQSPDDLRIMQVRSGAPAQRAGLRAGDRVVAINGVRLSNLSEDQRMSAFRASPLTLTVLRDDTEVMLTLVADK